jgi:hypothetical protein
MKNFSKRKRNIAGIETCCGDLVKQWLELVIIETVNENDFKSRPVVEFAG